MIDAIINIHAETVGSMLRPAELLAARDELAGGTLGIAEFKAIEDRAVDQAVAMQQEAGLPVITDGEMRRLSFQSQMTDAVDGFGEYGLDAFLWGDWHGDEQAGHWNRERPRALGAIGKLQPRRHMSVEEFTYLRARATSIPKVCLPSPSLWANFWSPERSAAAYPTLDSFLADVVDITRREVAELVRLGARYIQLDAPHYTAFLDPKTRAFYEDRGWPMAKWLDRGIALDNAVIDGWPGVTFGFHL